MHSHVPDHKAWCLCFLTEVLYVLRFCPLWTTVCLVQDQATVARLIEAVPRLEQILSEKPAVFSEWLPQYLGWTPAEQNAALH